MQSGKSLTQKQFQYLLSLHELQSEMKGHPTLREAAKALGVTSRHEARELLAKMAGVVDITPSAFVIVRIDPTNVEHHIHRPRTKLNVPKVRKMRRLAKDSVPQKALAAMFGVSIACVSKVVRRHTWSEVA